MATAALAGSTGQVVSRKLQNTKGILSLLTTKGLQYPEPTAHTLLLLFRIRLHAQRAPKPYRCNQAAPPHIDRYVNMGGHVPARTYTQGLFLGPRHYDEAGRELRGAVQDRL